MTPDYPLPTYAAYIWVAGDKLIVSFPPLKSSDRNSHTTILSADEVGAKVLLSVLTERARLTDKAAIGTKGSPVQYDVDTMLKVIRAAGDDAKITRIEPKKDISRESVDTILTMAGL